MHDFVAEEPSTSTPLRQDDRWMEGQDKTRVAVLE
jgi:hypothetical protein